MSNPTPPPDDWKPHAGGECPVPFENIKDVRFRHGEEKEYWRWGHWKWNEADPGWDIIAYRLAQSQKGGDVSCPAVAQTSSPGSNAAPKSNPSAAASETPETDAKLIGPMHGDISPNLFVSADFARTLERRARLAEADVKRLREALHRIIHRCHSHDSSAEVARAAIANTK